MSVLVLECRRETGTFSAEYRYLPLANGQKIPGIERILQGLSFVCLKDFCFFHLSFAQFRRSFLARLG